MKFKNKKSQATKYIVFSVISLFSLLICSFTFIAIHKSNSNNENVALANNDQTFFVNSNYIGPFDEDSQDCTLTLKCKSSVYIENIIATFRYGTSSTNIAHSHSKAVKNLDAGFTYTDTFTFPGKSLAALGSLYIIIDYVQYPNYQNIIYQEAFTITTAKKDFLNINYLLGKTWKSNVLAFRIIDSHIIYYDDVISAKDTLDFLAVDNYYRLDLSSITFLFDSSVGSYENATISFVDEYNLFPDFEKDDEDVIVLDLYIDMSYRPDISISFNRGFYVRPSDLHMSSTPKPGFQPTNYFYFPVNELERIVDYDFSFRIDGLGLNKSTFYLVLDYDVTQRLIGKCYESDYCVVGGIVS